MKMSRLLKPLLRSIGIALFGAASGWAVAAEFAVKVVQKEPPKEVDESIRKTLQTSAVQLLEAAKPVFEFWLSADIPLQSKPESPTKAMDAIKQSTVLGVVAVASNTRDYKDNDLASGVYTMRFGLQPQDGNHLGTAEFPYFAVLVSAKRDSKIDGITDYKTLVKASKEGTASDHPIILSLQPASSAEGDTPKLNEPAPEHKSVRLKIPARVAGTGEQTSVILELVYQGKGKV